MQNIVISCIDSRVESNGDMYGRFLFGPVPRGLAVTIANTLRRSLLSEVQSVAITHVEFMGPTFMGPTHEFSTLPGTKESVLDVLLNLKKLTFSAKRPVSRAVRGYCSGRGPGVLTGRDLKLPDGIHCTNPDQVIAHLTGNGHLQFACSLTSGKSYTMRQGALPKPMLNATRKSFLKEEKRDEAAQRRVGQTPEPPYKTTFPVDAVFMPVRRVSFTVHSDEDQLAFPLYVNSLQVTERVDFEIWTNGTVTPREAMHQAATHLIRVFSLFQFQSRGSIVHAPRVYDYRLKFMSRNRDIIAERYTLQTITPNHFTRLDIGVLPLSPIVFRDLKAQKIDRLSDFLHRSYDDLLQLPGMTTETLFEVLCLLRSYGIRFLPTFDTSLRILPKPSSDRTPQRKPLRRKRSKASDQNLRRQIAETTQQRGNVRKGYLRSKESVNSTPFLRVIGHETSDVGGKRRRTYLRQRIVAKALLRRAHNLFFLYPGGFFVNDNMIIRAVGRRKSATATVVFDFQRGGGGVVRVKSARGDGDDYEQLHQTMLHPVRGPLTAAGLLVADDFDFDILVKVKGGGHAAQADAIQLALARALILRDPAARQLLKPAGFLTRDARIKERKKCGLKKARKASQFSKR